MRGRKPTLNYAVIDPKIRKLYLSGMSLNEVARTLYLHPQTVKRRVEAMGLRVRGISEAMILHHRRTKSAS